MIKRYKILRRIYDYGSASPDKSIFKTNLRLSEALDELRSKLGIKDEFIDIGVETDPKLDGMGCGSSFTVEEDNTVDTIWANLTESEKKSVFDFAENWMDNEMVNPPAELLKAVSSHE